MDKRVSKKDNGHNDDYRSSNNNGDVCDACDVCDVYDACGDDD
jgi:hypothetical protein